MCGKKATPEHGETYGIHGGDTEYNIGSMQVPQYFPQDHVAPGSVGYQAVFHRLRIYCGGELIEVKETTRYNEETEARNFNSKYDDGNIRVDVKGFTQLKR